MRKYYTLVLITVTVVSFVCLVFYKTQYDKLYNVLQVLEFFGSEPKSARGPLWENAFLSGVETFRPPSFQRINDNAFVYSAFCFSTPGVRDDGHCGTVMAIAVVRTPLDASKLACKLWYEGSYSGLAGSFSSAETTAESAAASEGFKSYQLFCQNKFGSKVPFSVEFISEAKGESSLLRIACFQQWSTMNRVNLFRPRLRPRVPAVERARHVSVVQNRGSVFSSSNRRGRHHIQRPRVHPT